MVFFVQTTDQATPASNIIILFFNPTHSQGEGYIELLPIGWNYRPEFETKVLSLCCVWLLISGWKFQDRAINMLINLLF